MRIRRAAVSTMLIFILISPIIIARPQQDFLIGLNMVVEFTEQGIARVTLKQHPFDFKGESLISDKEVINEIIDEEESMINLVILFFTSNPSKAKYNIVSHTSLYPNEEVFSNTGTPGVMEKFKGALVLIVDIFLNSTSGFMKLGEDIYQVSIVDYFTLRSPGSWIDVMEIKFTGNVRLLNFSTEPTWAKPPSLVEENLLKWINLNEPDAPDNYVLTLEIPGVTFSKVVKSLKAEVSRVFFSNATSTLWLRIRNIGTEEGVFIVSLSEPCCEQARKIVLKPGEENWVKFPIHVTKEKEVLVRVFGEGEELLEKTVLLKGEESTRTGPSIVFLSGLLLTLLGAFLILAYITDKLKEQKADLTKVYGNF
ncbi:MAG: hypothetical protein QXT26_02175 [Thermoproteota archaeon]